MCGDDHEEQEFEEHAYQHALLALRSYFGASAADRSAALARAGAPDLPAYMDGLFQALLGLCVKESGEAATAYRLRLLAAQSVVLARLAGLVAARLPAGQDALRDAIEALMDGYAERDRPVSDHDHQHDDDHTHHAPSRRRSNGSQPM
jgi:hypothetical protein